jgi:hypothetical protein
MSEITPTIKKVEPTQVGVYTICRDGILCCKSGVLLGSFFFGSDIVKSEGEN